VLVPSPSTHRSELCCHSALICCCAMDEWECAVCFESNADPQQLPCDHLFCNVCVRRLCLNLSPSCPLCRHAFVPCDVLWSTRPLISSGQPDAPVTGLTNTANQVSGKTSWIRRFTCDRLRSAPSMSHEREETTSHEARRSSDPQVSNNEQRTLTEAAEQELWRRSGLIVPNTEHVERLVDLGIPRPFVLAAQFKTVISGRKRTTLWSQCDSQEYVYVAQKLFSVLCFCALEEDLGWTFEFSDGSAYVHNPPVLRYRACPSDDLQELRSYGLVRADEPKAIPNSIFPKQRSWWVLSNADSHA